ncbi:hypothetical protein IQ07DRAFT_221791 [Pyrenochaeta sp. DS3sAY3a]|nr:hypothetical protein IQ07DRAFT_221791 [Pyrenochaeta sp. DS3sAY3a]
MATPAAAAPTEAKNMDRRISLGKYVKRMSSVFKREKTSKAPSPSAPSPLRVEQQKEAPKEETAPVLPSPTTAPTATQDDSTALVAAAPVAKVLDRRAMQQERARQLFAKYGLTLESHEWIASSGPIPTVQRVEKSIRMRVHRSCHMCGSLYGADKVCLNCDHKRCKKCPRYPRKKSPEEKLKAKDPADKPKRKKVLTITTRAGNELAYQPATQRIRRSCHKCETQFVPPTATICEQCRHIRCTKCPREPAKLTKWSTGYPGDVESYSDEEVEKQRDTFRRTWRKPRARVRWECEKCHSAFLNGSPQCPGCGHERCDQCSRSPVKKLKKEEQFDPRIVAAVEAKLRALGVDDDSDSSNAVAL